MAKRRPSLVPLSHDHHHGLALALRLRQGESALLNDGWTHDRQEQAHRVQSFYEEELRSHFKTEEEVVFPVLVELVSVAAPIVAELLKQHFMLESLVTELASAKKNFLEEKLIKFGELLDQHIRIEERELFPLYEQNISVEADARVGREVAAMRGVQSGE
jgi:hemerythrin-like domain-containing protein